jgi:NUMOD3 motif
MRQLSETRKHNFYLYGLYCPYTNKLKYIGITTGTLQYRLNFHLRKPTNPKISKWFRELKKNNNLPHIKLIKEYFSYNDLLNAEIYEIKKYRELGYNLFNVSDGGDINPMFGKTHSEESKKKISLHHKGLKRTNEQKEKRRELLKALWSDENWSDNVRKKMKGNKNSLGHIHSEYSKNLISNKQKKKWKTPEYRKKQLLTMTGRTHSEFTKKLMSKNNSGINNPMYGKPLSKESLKKRSEKVIREGIYKGKNNPNFKYEINKNDLFDLYMIKNITIHNIAIIYGCCNGTIINKLKEYSIKKPKSNKYNLNINDIILYKNRGMNLVEIGKIYGCSNKIISKILKRNGK